MDLSTLDMEVDKWTHVSKTCVLVLPSQNRTKKREPK